MCPYSRLEEKNLTQDLGMSLEHNCIMPEHDFSCATNTVASPPATRYWNALSSADFAALDKNRTIVVLPVAATEQHGPHLPLKVDTALADAMIAASLPHLPDSVQTFFLPTQAVGYSPEHTAFAGTLSFSAETVIRVWTEIAQCVAASGIRKLLIFNTHGGNVGLLDVVARDLRARLGMLVYTCSWFNLPLGEAAAAFDAHEHRFGIHAGAIETSLMLAVHPQEVRMNLAQSFSSTSEERAVTLPILGNGRSAKLAWQMQDYNEQGAVGNAAAASAEKGRALLQAVGRALADLLVEFDRLSPDMLR